MRAARLLGVLGAVSGFFGVAAGAIGTHALRATISPERLQAFETAARYQILHALALLAISQVGSCSPRRSLG